MIDFPAAVLRYSLEELAEFGFDSPKQREGQPAEIVPCSMFLACADSSFITGQVLHPNGGEVVNG